MSKVLKLSRTVIRENQEVEETKLLILNFNAKLATRMKLDLNFDVFDFLESKDTQSRLSRIVVDIQEIYDLAEYFWAQENPDISEWLDPDNRELIRKYILDQIVNFSPPHLQEPIQAVVNKELEAASKLGMEAAVRMEAVIDEVLDEQISALPSGQKLVLQMKEKLKEFTSQA